MIFPSDNAPTLLARTHYRHQREPFGIRRRDRLSHIYVVGKTGTGKSTLLRTLIGQDLASGEGLALLDPHGDLVEQVHALVPPDRARDVLYINVPDAGQAWYFNPLAGVPKERRSLAVAGLVEVFKKLWAEDWGPRLEHLLRNVLFALLEFKGATFKHASRLLTDKDFRRAVIAHVTNEEVRTFWGKEYEGYSKKFRAVVAAPLQNKLGALLTDPLLNRILTGARSSFDPRALMDRGGVLLVNLSKGRIGEGPAMVLGSFLAAHIGLAGLARADQPVEARRPFFVYMDEFQTFATLSLVTMLAELRKYGVGLTLAHQYLAQLDRDIRDAVVGNAGTLVCFRVGAHDAAYLAQELAPSFEPLDLIRLPNYRVCLRMLIDGEAARPFSAETLPPTS